MHRNPPNNTWHSPSYNSTPTPNPKRPRLPPLSESRRRLCRNSPFWTATFDLAAHRASWTAGLARERAHKAALAFAHPPSPTPIRPCLDGRPLTTNHSAVLLYPTIFSPSWQAGKHAIAPWPSKSEMKYEGDDRIATDPLHQRCLGAPRVEGNETVNWQHRAIVQQEAFDDFLFPLPGEVEVWLRGHWVEDLEVRDEVGRRLIGGELMGSLEVGDQFLE